MSDSDLTSKIQAIEQTLVGLDTTLEGLRSKIEGLEREVSELKRLGTKVGRLQQIEDTKVEIEILELTARLDALKGTPRTKGRVKRFFLNLPQNLLTYWTLLAFVIAAIIAGYVYKKYGVGYFETYQNIANTKRSANYYLRAADALISRAEFAAAEGAFKTATEIDPHNIAAREGLMLSQVLKSQDGQTDPPEIVKARLDYLTAEPAFKGNPLLPYFQGRIAALQGNNKGRKEARDFFLSSVKQIETFNQAHPSNPNRFVGNYLELGILDMWDGNIKGAISYFKTPGLVDANQTTALNHLAECYVISDQFPEAHVVLSNLYGSSPRLETYLVFGDFYRYRFATDPDAFKQDLEYAKTMDRLAEDSLSGSAANGASKNATLTAGIDYGRMHFLPFPLANTPRFEDHSVADAEKPEQYRALTNYALSLDHALAGDFSKADQYYSQALATDTFNRYRCRFVYMTRFYRSKLPKSYPELKKWFDEKAESLAEGRCLGFSPLPPAGINRKQTAN